MRILSVQLKNIKSHRELELDFAPGINVLSGANGVGKSTIFEAIGYALFGVDAQSFVGNVERFITIGARRGEIAVTFQVDAECFRISRSVGTPARWLLARQVGGYFEVEEHKDARETEARLSKLLGLDNGRSLAEQFELVIGPLQNEFLGPFVERRPTTRRNKFDQILGIDSWRKTFSETGALLKTVQNKIEVLQGALGPLQDQVAGLPEKSEQHKATLKGLAGTEASVKQQQQALKELEVRLTDIDQREQTVKELGIEIDKLKERIGNGQERVGRQKALVAEAELARKIVAENRPGKQAFETAEQRLVELRKQLSIQRQLEKEVAELANEASRLAERHATETKGIEQTANDLAVEEQALGERRQALAVDESVRKLAMRLPKIRGAITRAQNQLGLLKGRRDGLDEGREKLAEGICPFFQEPCMNIAERPPGDVFSAKLAELDQEREKFHAELHQLEQEDAKASNASESIKAFEFQILGLDERMKQLTEKRQANQDRRAGLEFLRNQQAAFQQQLDEKTQALAAYANLQGEIETAETERKKHQAARDLYVKNQDQASRLEGLHADLQKFEQLLAQLRKDLTDQEQALAVAGKTYHAEQHAALKLRKDTLRQELGALGQKVAGLKAETARLAGEIDQLKRIATEIAAKEARIKAYGAKEALVKFLRNRVFNKVSAHLSERFREEISQRANAIYRVIAEADEELAWGEDYRILLRDLVDGKLRERADDQLSGGQTMSAVVALRLALLQTIGARIAFFDEPTSNLDAARRENLARAFRAIDVGKEELSEHWYDQLFLISHDVAFTEITDQLIEIASPDN